MEKRIALMGVILISIAIILGAFGAHGLKELVSAEKLTSFEVGIRYQMYMGICLLIIGLNADKFKFSLKTIVNLLIFGVVLFSGSIYLLSLQELIPISLKFLGPITPIGGTLMIIGFCLLARKLIRD